MPQIIEVPNYGMVEFPDDMTDAQIVAAIKKTALDYRRPAETFDPTEGMSGTQKFLAGVGKGMTDFGRGAGQLLGLVSDVDIAEARRRDAPLMESGAAKGGSILGQAALLAPLSLVPGANTYAGAALMGGGAGALQPVLEGESRLANTALGAAGGMGGQFVGNRLGRVLSGSNNMPKPKAEASATGGQASAGANVSMNPTLRGSGGGYTFGSVGDDASAGLNPAQQRVMGAGQKMGFKLTPGQASGSRALQQLEAKLESQPMTSGRFNTIKANNQATLNRIAANSIGETSDTLDSATLGQAQERLSGIYKLVANDKPRAIDPDDFLQKMSGIENEFEGMVSIADNALVKKFLNYASNGQATGRQLQDLASKMGKVAANQMTSPQGDRAMGLALFQVKDHVDDLLQSGLTGKTAQQFADARGQYRNLMLLTQRNGVINPSSGDVAGNALAGLLQQKDRRGFLFGQNQSDLYDAARFAQAFRPIVGDSGTATRSALPSPTDFVLSLPFSLATRAYTSSPVVRAAASAGDVSRNGVAPQLAPFAHYFGLLGGPAAAQ